jgi:hypothetical protein
VFSLKDLKASKGDTLVVDAKQPPRPEQEDEGDAVEAGAVDALAAGVEKI